MKSADIRKNGTIIRFDANVLEPMEPRLFDPVWLQETGLSIGQADGRGTAYFLRHEGREMVLRHFRRGGLVGRVNRDLYLRAGAGQSRAFREFDLLAEMQAAGLRVPAPVAARYAPAGPFYRADLITLRIPEAAPLHDILCARAVTPDTWEAIGAAVRQMHDAAVFHSDLNARNILLDAQGDVWIIDFDKCERRAPGVWMQANLDRLHRSLDKFAAVTPEFHWTAQDWTAFRAGYGM